MSFNRENITWQSEDGTWNRGFYEVVWYDHDGDPEWNVEYGENLRWCLTGLASEDDACGDAFSWAWGSGNPGGSTVYPQGDPYCEGLLAELKSSEGVTTERPRGGGRLIVNWQRGG